MVMDGSKEIHSDQVEPRRSEDNDNSFFKKYTLVSPQEGELVDGHVFKKYVPIRESTPEQHSDQSELQHESPLDVGNLKATVKQPSSPRTTLLLWASVVVAALLLVGWIVFYEHLRTEQPQANESPSTQTSTDGGDSASANAGLQIPEEANNQSDESVEEKPGDSSTTAGLHRLQVPSPGILLNAMLARARGYEDRGMLVRAEEEYRAAVNNFPKDKLGQ